MGLIQIESVNHLERVRLGGQEQGEDETARQAGRVWEALAGGLRKGAADMTFCSLHERLL